MRGRSSGAGRQVGFYLQDELLEEEKHERTQRNDFFLGRPWAICSWRKRDKQKSESQDKNPPTSQQTQHQYTIQQLSLFHRRKCNARKWVFCEPDASDGIITDPWEIYTYLSGKQATENICKGFVTETFTGKGEYTKHSAKEENHFTLGWT